MKLITKFKALASVAVLAASVCFAQAEGATPAKSEKPVVVKQVKDNKTTVVKAQKQETVKTTVKVVNDKLASDLEKAVRAAAEELKNKPLDPVVKSNRNVNDKLVSGDPKDELLKGFRPKAPKAPKAPRAPKEPKPSRNVEVHVNTGDINVNVNTREEKEPVHKEPEHKEPVKKEPVKKGPVFEGGGPVCLRIGCREREIFKLDNSKVSLNKQNKPVNLEKK